MDIGPLSENQDLRAAELDSRIKKYKEIQPERINIDQLDAPTVKSITGANAWELSEDEFVRLGGALDMYACFIEITDIWQRFIVDGIKSGAVSEINKEALDTLAWRNAKTINEAWKEKHGVYLWEPKVEEVEESEEEANNNQGPEQLTLF